MSSVLVTGGAGFIGTHTVKELIEDGFNVGVLDSLETQAHLNASRTAMDPNVKLIKGDVRYKKSWERALTDVEYVIHLAGAVGIAQSFWQVKKYMDTNTIGTTNLYQTIVTNKEIRKRIKKIVVASSKSCYGEGSYKCKEHGSFNPGIRSLRQLIKKEWDVKCPICGRIADPIPISEEKPLQNLNPYSLSKYTTEQLALDFGYSLEIPTVALRYFNVYGSGQSLSNPYTGVMAIFLSRIKNNRSPIVFEDGLQQRDFIHVSDVARVNVLSLEKGSGVYNVGTGKPTTLLRMVKLINDHMGSSVMPEIPQKFRQGDNRHDFANNAKLSGDLGLNNYIPLSKGLEELVSWSKTASAVDWFDKEERERDKFLSI